MKKLPHPRSSYPRASTQILQRKMTLSTLRSAAWWSSSICKHCSLTEEGDQGDGSERKKCTQIIPSLVISWLATFQFVGHYRTGLELIVYSVFYLYSISSQQQRTYTHAHSVGSFFYIYFVQHGTACCGRDIFFRKQVHRSEEYFYYNYSTAIT